jgi:tetratricopeptide (TPR) repeat protein
VLVRMAAISALRHLPAADRIALLTPLLGDRFRSVRQVAAAELTGAGVAALTPSDDEKFRAAMREYLDYRLAKADTPESHMAIGGFALSRRKWEEAEAAFRTATEMDPQLAEGWMMQAQLREARGDLAGAEKALGNGIAAAPANIDLLLARAALDARQQRTDDSLGWYKRAQALAPERPDIWLGMAVTALYGNKPQQALDYAREATKREPGNGEAQLVLAMAHAITGDIPSARAAAERARTLAPQLQFPPELEQILKGTP